VRIAGASLGVAAVLFAGLAIGALDPRLQLPEILQRLGLVLFVYTVGVSAGPGFAAALRRGGLRDSALAAGLLLLAATLTFAVRRVLGLSSPLAAGLFAGAFTNTPALAAVLEHVHAGPGGAPAEPVVAYALSYPFGVIAPLLALMIARRTLFRGRSAEAPEPLLNATLRVTRAEVCRKPLGALARDSGWRTRFARLGREGAVRVIDPKEPLRIGDLVSVVAPRSELEILIAALGERAPLRLDLDRSVLDYRRIFVSSADVVEHRIRDLAGLKRLGARVTRVKRGEVDLLPHGGTVLLPGDRVRVLAARDRMDEVAAYFGDSYHALAEIDVLTFGFGIALGLLIAIVPIPLPGREPLRLGIAGGPLISGLVLGALGRSGRVVWSLPWGANLTLRQIGLVLFLAGVGTRSGWVFATTFGQAGGPALMVAGALITFVVAWVALWAGAALRIAPGVMAGKLAGIQTQPAVLAFAKEGSADEGPDVGYAGVYPLATILKIVLAQVLLGWPR
jgi:putative transport protein